MMAQTCTECELLWQAYEHATHCQRIIEHKSATESGLEVLLRKASMRSEEARMALQDHEAIHMTATATASGVA
jgi:hypothetical protein